MRTCRRNLALILGSVCAIASLGKNASADCDARRLVVFGSISMDVTALYDQTGPNGPYELSLPIGADGRQKKKFPFIIVINESWADVNKAVIKGQRTTTDLSLTVQGWNTPADSNYLLDAALRSTNVVTGYLSREQNGGKEMLLIEVPTDWNLLAQILKQYAATSSSDSLVVPKMQPKRRNFLQNFTEPSGSFESGPDSNNMMKFYLDPLQEIPGEWTWDKKTITKDTCEYRCGTLSGYAGYSLHTGYSTHVTLTRPDSTHVQGKSTWGLLPSPQNDSTGFSPQGQTQEYCENVPDGIEKKLCLTTQVKQYREFKVDCPDN